MIFLNFLIVKLELFKNLVAICVKGWKDGESWGIYGFG